VLMVKKLVGLSYLASRVFVARFVEKVGGAAFGVLGSTFDVLGSGFFGARQRQSPLVPRYD
jgi:hypothetical protein